ncbi:MAG: sulfatase-like hydrolase/transferase [Fimbriimonadaceae bacterium]|nr:sulfatase-like hydrolase/transferase [Fimbriimonadaceae bacterium]
MPSLLDRRTALGALAGAGAAVALSSRGRAQEAARRPNVLFILIDDLGPTDLGCYGHPFLKTPHLDRLAAEGAQFRSNFVAISLCSPSRACCMTGCVPQRTTVLTNEGQELDHRLPTFATQLQAAGYQTGYVGKWHQGNFSDPRPGYDYWLSFQGQGVYRNPTLNENGREFQATGHMTELLTKHAVDFIRRPHTQPFCLYLAHKAVHGPFEPTAKNAGKLADTALPEPPNAGDDHFGKPFWLRASHVRGTKKEAIEQHKDLPVPDRLPPAKAWNPANSRAQFECVMDVDDSVGEVLRVLEETGQLDHTLVIFTSDNGYFHGEHRRGDKRLPYEEALRIPLLVRYPALVRAGLQVEALTSSLDICPTILDLCGAPPIAVQHGRSLRPVIGDGRAPAGWRDEVFGQYFIERSFLPGLPTVQAVRTTRYKYIAAPDFPGDDELYDLQTDPAELRNLTRDPALAEVKADLQRRLAAFLAMAEASKLPPPPPPPAEPAKVLFEIDLSRADLQPTVGGALTSQGAAVATVATVAGRPARRFDGQASLSVESKASPAIQMQPFWVRAELLAAGPDGVILSHGGATNGYCLELRGGQFLWHLRSGGAEAQVLGGQVPTQTWLMVTAALTNERKLEIHLNGTRVALRDGGNWIRNLPNDGLTLGADLASRCGDGEAKGFQGALAKVSIGIGTAPG